MGNIRLHCCPNRMGWTSYQRILAQLMFVVWCHTCDEFLDFDIPSIWDAREVREDHTDGSCSIVILKETH